MSWENFFYSNAGDPENKDAFAGDTDPSSVDSSNDGFLSNMAKGFKSGGAGVIGGIADLLHGDTVGDYMNNVVDSNQRTKNYDSVFSMDYLTNPSGLAYDTANMLGSMAALAPAAMAVPETAVGGATATIGGGGARLLAGLGAKKAAQTLGTEAAEKTLVLGVRGAATSIPESMSEGGNVRREAIEQGLDSPDLRAWETTGENIPTLALSNGLEYMLLGGKIFKPSAEAGESLATRAMKAPLRAAPAIGVNATQNGIEELVQQTIQDANTDQPYGNPLNPFGWTDNQRQAFEVGMAGSAVLGGASGGYHAMRANDKGSSNTANVEMPEDLQSLIDNANAPAPQTEEAPQQIANKGYNITDEVSDTGLAAGTEQKLNNLSNAFEAQFGEPLNVTSMKRNGDGSSWHDSGQAVDLAGGILETNPEARQWLMDNGPKYGLTGLDEYANPSEHATGGHIHFSDHDEQGGVSDKLGGNIADMISQKTGLPADWVWAQMYHETGGFDSDLAKEDHNYGGIKNGDGSYRHFDSDEEYADYAARNLEAYRSDGLFDATNIDEFAAALKHGGYFEDSLDNYTKGLKSALGNAGTSSGTRSSARTSATDYSKLFSDKIIDFADYMRSTSDDPGTINFFEDKFNKRNDTFIDTPENRQDIESKYGEQLKNFIDEQKSQQSQKELNSILDAKAENTQARVPLNIQRPVAKATAQSPQIQMKTPALDKLSDNDRKIAQQYLSSPEMNTLADKVLIGDKLAETFLKSAPQAAQDALLESAMQRASTRQDPVSAAAQGSIDPAADAVVKAQPAPQTTNKGENINENAQSTNAEASENINSTNQNQNSELGQSNAAAQIEINTPKEPWQMQTKALDTAKQHIKQGPREIAYTTSPSEVNNKIWYHGTGTANLTADRLDTNSTKIDGLFGHGIYLTDSHNIAEGYAQSRGKRTGTPTIYKTKVNVGNVLDLEKPIPENAYNVFRDMAKNISERWDDAALLKRVEKTKGESGEKTYREFSKGIEEISQDQQLPSSEFVEDFQDLSSKLKEAGYDAYTHVGGKRTGKAPHQVLIMLDPNETMSRSGRKRQITEFKNSKTVDEQSLSATKENKVFPDQGQQDEKPHANSTFVASTHTDAKTGKKNHTANFREPIKKKPSPAVTSLAKRNGGHYSPTAQEFLFNDAKARDRFIKEADAFMYPGTKSSAKNRIEAMRSNVKFIADTDLSGREKNLQGIGKQMGVPVMFFEGHPDLHGFYSKGISFLNRKSAINPKWTFWHETFHWLKANNESLYNDMVSHIKNREDFTQKQINDYRDQIGRPELSDNDAIEEMMADYMPDVRRRVELFKSLSKENPSLAERFVAWIRDVMDRFHEFMRAPYGLNGEQQQAMTAAFAKLARDMVDADGKKLFRVSNRTNVIQLANGSPLSSAAKYSIDNSDNLGNNESKKVLNDKQKQRIFEDVVSRMNDRIDNLVKQGTSDDEISKELDDENSVSREKSLRAFTTYYNSFISAKTNKRNLVERITGLNDLDDTEIEQTFNEFKRIAKEMLNYAGFIYKETAVYGRGNDRYVTGFHTWQEAEKSHAEHGGSAAYPGDNSKQNSVTDKHSENKGAFSSSQTEKYSVQDIDNSDNVGDNDGNKRENKLTNNIHIDVDGNVSVKLKYPVKPHETQALRIARRKAEVLDIDSSLVSKGDRSTYVNLLPGSNKADIDTRISNGESPQELALEYRHKFNSLLSNYSDTMPEEKRIGYMLILKGAELYAETSNVYERGMAGNGERHSESKLQSGQIGTRIDAAGNRALLGNNSNRSREDVDGQKQNSITDKHSEKGAFSSPENEKYSISVSDVKNLKNRAISLLADKFKTKPANNVVVQKKKQDGPDTLGLKDYSGHSPSWIADHHKFFKPMFEHADATTEMQESLRNDFSKQLKEINTLLKNEQDMADVNSVIMEGDLKAVEFSSADLKARQLSDNAVQAYFKIRDVFDHLYKLANEARTQVRSQTKHLSKEQFDALKQNKFVDIQKVTPLNNTLRVTYKAPKFWERNNIVDAKTLATMQKDDCVQITKTIDRHNGSYDITYNEHVRPITKKVGYMAHIFHEFMVYEKDGDQYISLDSGKTMDEAIAKANDIAKQNPDKQYFVRPKIFNQQHESEIAAVVGDQEYFKMLEHLTGDMEMTPEEAKEMLDTTGLSRKSRHRFYGNAMHRTGAGGYETDLMWVLNKHVNTTTRYAAMEGFKPWALSYFERVFGRFDNDYSNNTNAQYVKDYINDFNGNPTVLENAANRIIRNSVIGKFVDNFDDRPAVSLESGITGTLARCMLGFGSVSSALMNVTQIINIAAITEDIEGTTRAFARTFKPSKRDQMLIDESGVLNDITGDADSSGYSQNRTHGKIGKGRTAYKTVKNNINWVLDKGMYFFSKADVQMRKTAILAGYDKAMKDHHYSIPKGMLYSPEAMKYAKYVVNRKGNFIYGIHDAPNIMRRTRGSIVGPLSLMFMKYPIKQMELMAYLLERRSIKGNAIFWGGYIMMAGLLQFPGLDWLNDIVSTLTGGRFNPKTEAKKYLIEHYGDNPFTRAAIYGLVANSGIDISQRTGLANAFSGVLAGGPLTSVSAGVARSIANGNPIEAIKSLSPGLGNVMQAVVGESRTTRGRKATAYDEWDDRLLKAIGFRSVEESKTSDVKSIEIYERDQLIKEKQKAVDAFIKDPTSQNAMKLKELGVKPQTVKDERKKKEMTNKERNMSSLSKKEKQQYNNLSGY